MAAKRKTTSQRRTAVQPAVNQAPQSALPSMMQRSGPSMALVVLLIALSFFTGYLFFKVQNLEKGTGGTAQQLDPGQPQAPREIKIKKPTTDEHWRGSQQAKVVLVEYSDLECPFCKQAHPTIQRLMEENEGKLAWVFRHYPLSFHPKAQKAAEAVECAAEQGGNDAFWNLTDAIYEKMPDIEVSTLPALAGELGMDANALKTCMDSNKYADKIKDQQSEGTTAGVQATPSNVLYNLDNDKTLLIEGALPYEQFKTQLDDFMK